MGTETDVFVDGETAARLLLGGEPSGANLMFLLDVLDSAHDEALHFLAGQVESHTGRGGDLGPTLKALRSGARGRQLDAVLTLFEARVAEAAGDADTACDLINNVLALRPHMEPALHDAAHYAAVRGDYIAADGYLRRASEPGSLQPALTQVLAHIPRNVPRNNPCPCGSGRKFKVCCQRRGGVPPLSTRAQLLYALLGTYAERAPGIEIIRPLVARMTPSMQNMMFSLDLALVGSDLVDRFLTTRGGWLRPDERELVEDWQAIGLALHEIVDIEPGKGLTVRALPDSTPIHLVDRLFSSSVRGAEMFLGRVLHDGTERCMVATPVPVPRHRGDALLDLLASDPSMEQIADFFGPGSTP